MALKQQTIQLPGYDLSINLWGTTKSKNQIWSGLRVPFLLFGPVFCQKIRTGL